jgi:hypothetical protein
VGAVQAARVTAGDEGNGISEVRREPVDVMFLDLADTQSAITEGWQRLEGLLGDLRCRHLFGTVEVQTHRGAAPLTVTAPKWRVGQN